MKLSVSVKYTTWVNYTDYNVNGAEGSSSPQSIAGPGTESKELLL